MERGSNAVRLPSDLCLPCPRQRNPKGQVEMRVLSFPLRTVRLSGRVALFRMLGGELKCCIENLPESYGSFLQWLG